jgi:ELWxxDGT repeat protein
MQRWFFLIGTFVLVSVFLVPASTHAQDQRCFPETGFCISGRIRSFWEQNGGLPVFGFPTGPQREELVEGRPRQVQLFERNRLELHPENAAPYDVLLGRLGVDVLSKQGRGNWQDFSRSGSDPSCRTFEATGQSVCGEILRAWQANGLEFDGQRGTSEAESLALFGLPISAPSPELVEGKVFVVQWFERARFELHPENAPPYNVLLGLLGNELNEPLPMPISAGAEIDSLTTAGNQVFFSARTAEHGIELWRSDGTTAATRLVRDLIPGREFGWPRHLAALGNVVLFAARERADGPDLLWRSDGTEAGTYPLLNGDQLADPWQLTTLGNRVFFVGSDADHGQELWVSNGTPEGTRLVRDIYPGVQGIYPIENKPMGYRHFSLTAVGERLFFTAEAPDTGYGLWVSDGTAGGTGWVASIASSAEYWSLTNLNGVLLFIGRTGRLNYGMYRSDGTNAGTTLIEDISYSSDPGTARIYPPIDELTAIGRFAYFQQLGAVWRTDGTAQSFATVSTPYLGGPIGSIDNSAYYLSFSPQAGLLLIEAESAAAFTGKNRVVLNVAPTLSQPQGAFYPFGKRVLLPIQGRERGELWVSDGTESGTQPILAVRGQVLGSPLSFFTRHATLGNQILFALDNGIHGDEVWISDGTPAGTRLLRDIQLAPPNP